MKTKFNIKKIRYQKKDYLLSQIKTSFWKVGIAFAVVALLVGLNFAFAEWVDPTEEPPAGNIIPTFSGLDVRGGIYNEEAGGDDVLIDDDLRISGRLTVERTEVDPAASCPDAALVVFGAQDYDKLQAGNYDDLNDENGYWEYTWFDAQDYTDIIDGDCTFLYDNFCSPPPGNLAQCVTTRSEAQSYGGSSLSVEDAIYTDTVKARVLEATENVLTPGTLTAIVEMNTGMLNATGDISSDTSVAAPSIETDNLIVNGLISGTGLTIQSDNKISAIKEIHSDEKVSAPTIEATNRLVSPFIGTVEDPVWSAKVTVDPGMPKIASASCEKTEIMIGCFGSFYTLGGVKIPGMPVVNYMEESSGAYTCYTFGYNDTAGKLQLASQITCWDTDL